MNRPTHNIVAKAGGTSMSNPELVQEQLTQPDNQAAILVVSAPGLDQPAGFNTKVTDMLKLYQREPTVANLRKIQERYSYIADRLGGTATRSIVDQISADLQNWSDARRPLEALGEYWSARQFSAYSGRRFVDAQRIIRTDSRGNIDIDQTQNYTNKELRSDEEVVVPGYYGVDSRNIVRLLGRGGSDITGAVLALATQAMRYDNWSDVPGFLFADPAIVESARLNQFITYREAREMGSNGSQLLHPSVIKILGRTGMPTKMKNTFSKESSTDTLITDDRKWDNSPLCGVTGLNVSELSLHEFGINEKPGATLGLYNWLNDHDISYAHTATGTDDISIFFTPDQAAKLTQNMGSIPVSPNTILNVNDTNVVHIVGEGLARSGVERMRTLSKIMPALEESGIDYKGSTDVSQSSSLTIFVSPGKAALNSAITTVHEVLFN